jgi:hypothetical protein
VLYIFSYYILVVGVLFKLDWRPEPYFQSWKGSLLWEGLFSGLLVFTVLILMLTNLLRASPCSGHLCIILYISIDINGTEELYLIIDSHREYFDSPPIVDLPSGSGSIR